MIEFENVSFSYPSEVLALNGINLKIDGGSIVAVVGENGAGKTTLVRHINGLLKPSLGKVRVFGKNTRDASIAELSKKLGVVFQNPDNQLFSDTVTNEILFGLKNFHLDTQESKKQLNLALDSFDLRKYEDVSPMLLSGGEKKRLCLAVVLSWNPQVLILDEPTVGQDFFQKERILEMILEQNRSGKTIIIVSHDIEFLWPLQPRVIAMSSGSIIADGGADEVLSNHKVLQNANLIMPQLLELWTRLQLDGYPPPNVDDAADRLVSVLKGDSRRTG